MLMPTSRLWSPGLLPGFLVVKPRSLRLPGSKCHLHRPMSTSGEEVDFGDEPALPDTSKFSHISEEEMQMYIPAMVLPSGEVVTAEGISSILFNCFSIKLERCFNISFEFLL